MTQKQYVALCYPIMYIHTKFGTPTLNTMNTIFQELRSDFKVTVTQKQYATVFRYNVYRHTKFGIPTLTNTHNIADILQTQQEGEMTDTLIMLSQQRSLWGHKHVIAYVWLLPEIRYSTALLCFVIEDRLVIYDNDIRDCK